MSCNESAVEAGPGDDGMDSFCPRQASVAKNHLIWTFNILLLKLHLHDQGLMMMMLLLEMIQIYEIHFLPWWCEYSDDVSTPR